MKNYFWFPIYPMKNHFLEFSSYEKLFRKVIVYV